MAYQPIENYGIIGNMRTAALVGMNGSIDWFCVPSSIHRACSPPSWTTRREAGSRSRPRGKASGRNSSIGRKPTCWSPAFSRRTVSEN